MHAPSLNSSFFHEHNVRYPQRIEQRIEAIKRSAPLTHGPAVIEPSSLLVKALSEQLRATLQAIDSFDQAIAERAPAHPDFHIFDSLPAAGPVLAPRLLTAFGEQRERYPRAQDLQRYAGVAPVTVHCGNSHWVHWRWSCPTFLRQTFVEWAALTIPRSFWANAFTASSAPPEKPIRPRYARSPTNGSVSCTAAGSHASRMTNRSI